MKRRISASIATGKPIEQIVISFDPDRAANFPANVIVHYSNGTRIEASEIEVEPTEWDIPPGRFTQFEAAFASREGLGMVVTVTMAGGDR